MKKILIVLSLMITSLVSGQTRKDTIKGTLNIQLLNSVLLEVSNEMTKDTYVKLDSVTKTFIELYGKDSGVVHKYHGLNFKAAEYQSSYLAKNVTVYNPKDNWHRNYKTHRGVLLHDVVERVDYFDPKKTVSVCAEICTIGYLHKAVTYEDLAKQVINNFFGSFPHRRALLSDRPYLSFSSTEGMFGFNGEYKCVFVVGVLTDF